MKYRNQCDGCMQGAKLKGNLHVDVDGLAFMCCQKHMYKQEKQNWFNTLNEALESENLLESWQISYPGIGYDEQFAYTWDDGTKYGHFVSIHRSEQGKYERPVHYARG